MKFLLLSGNKKGSTKKNCRWISVEEQQRYKPFYCNYFKDKNDVVAGRRRVDSYRGTGYVG